MSIGIILLALHMLGDFPLQTDWMAANKFEDPKALAAHVAVHFALYAVVLGGLYGTRGFLIAILVASQHLMIDRGRWAEPKEEFEMYPLFVDQSLHATAIAAATVLF